MAGLTYFTIFAGRKRYLNVLMAYVRQLLEQRTVDRVHVWNYARTPADREYVSSLGGHGIEVLPMPNSDKLAKFPNKWKGYYAFYAALLSADDLLIKCDDDIGTG